MKSSFIKMLKMSAFYLIKQKSFAPKKICGMLLIETLNCKIHDFLNSNKCFACNFMANAFLYNFENQNTC